MSQERKDRWIRHPKWYFFSVYECPQCRTFFKRTFVVCPQCGAVLSQKWITKRDDAAYNIQWKKHG